jgi:hypothetical protein
MIFIFPTDGGGGGGGGGGGTPSSAHVHVEEDLSDQIDGTKMTFQVSQDFISKSLTVFYRGVAYTLDNDFTETDENNVASVRKFTFIYDDGEPFPPEVGSPMVAHYRRKP